MLNLVAQRDEELQILSNWVARVGAVIRPQALVQFPILEIAFDLLISFVRLASEGLRFLPEKNGVKKTCPCNHHQSDVAAGFELHCGLVVNFYG